MRHASARSLRFLVYVSFVTGLAAQSGSPAPSGAPAPAYRWTTIAGRASIGNEDGPATAARFNQPHGLASDLAGNLYVADAGNHTIRKITPEGLVSTFAGQAGAPGSADGTGTGARFRNPAGIAVDRTGNLYVADTGNHTIRKITPTGVVTTLAGQPGKAGNADGVATAALFDTPTLLTVDPNGTVYLLNGGLRKITAGLVQTVPLPAAVGRSGQSFAANPVGGPAVDASGQLYLYDQRGSVLRLDTAGNLTELIASSNFSGTPLTVFNDVNGNIYWVRNLNYARDGNRHEANGLRSDGSIDFLYVTFEDEYGYGVRPLGITVDRDGHWYNTRSSDHAIMRDGQVYAGTASVSQPSDGAAGTARFESIYDLALDPAGNLWIQESNFHVFSLVTSGGTAYASSLRKLAAADLSVTTARPAQFSSATSELPGGVGTDPAGQPYIALAAGLSTQRGVFAALTGENLGPDSLIQDFTMDASGNMWLCNGFSSLLRRRPGGDWTTVAGGGSYLDTPKDGQGTEARLGYLFLLATDADGNCYALSRYESPNGAQPACFIRKITPAGAVTTLGKNLARTTGPAGAVVAEYPAGFACNGPGKFIVTYRHEVIQVDEQGNETVLGGKTGEPGSADGIGGQARLAQPGSVVVDQQGNLFVADGEGTTLRQGQYLGLSPGIASQPQSLTVAVGGTVTFSVTPNETPNPAYQWYFNDAPYAGATGRTLSFANARTSDAGDYHVVITNALGSITSAKATLTVTAGPTPPSSSPGGSGGGGAPSVWFLATLATLGWLRRVTGGPAGRR